MKDMAAFLGVVVAAGAAGFAAGAFTKLMEWWESGPKTRKIPPHLQKEFETSKKFWKKEFSDLNIENSINIAVVGVVDAGKTTLANYLRGLHDRDTDAAETKATQNTRIATPYPIKGSKDILIWDTPGTGTKEFPLGDFCEKHAFFMFDCVLVVGDRTFNEVDSKLCCYCHKHDIPFALVRSKMDDVFRNNKRMTLTKTDDEIRDEAVSEMKNMYSSTMPQDMAKLSIPIFCISAHNGQEALDSINPQPFEEQKMFTFIQNGVLSRFTQ